MHVFLVIFCAFTFFCFCWKKMRKLVLTLKNDFDQLMAWEAPICWSKYTTNAIWCITGWLCIFFQYFLLQLYSSELPHQSFFPVCLSVSLLKLMLAQWELFHILITNTHAIDALNNALPRNWIDGTRGRRDLNPRSPNLIDDELDQRAKVPCSIY